MTSYENDRPRPEVGHFNGFDHLHFYVSNAKQVADWYILRFGFERVAYRGLETGSRKIATHVVRQNDVVLAFTCALTPEVTDIGKQVMITGDVVKDVAFRVEDCEALYKKAMSRGAVSVMEPQETKDEFGSVVLASVKTYGDTIHTFVQRNDYKGAFLPGYKAVDEKDPIAALLPAPELGFIDHVVGNQPDLKMEEAADWYEKTLDFHRFWSVDDKQIHTEYSSLRSIVMTDYDQTIKMPINEPAKGKKKSQIQEYVDWHGGAGVQHVALNTKDILTAITNLKKRGVEFLNIPEKYYDNLIKRLEKSPVNVKEDLDIIRKLKILVDFDDNGYLLQIFTKPVEDRPTLFYEVIQRNNHEGFGAGNFKALFECIEKEQDKRGNLTDTN